MKARYTWLVEVASGAAPIFGSVADREHWGANRRRDLFKDFCTQAAVAAELTHPRVQRFFAPTAWKNLDSLLFPYPIERPVERAMGIGLTPEQENLLSIIVEGHRSHQGKPFLFTRSHSGAALSYAGGHSVAVTADESDFVQLQSASLVNWTRVGKVLNGKPTQHGIDLADSLKGNLTPDLLAANRQERTGANTRPNGPPQPVEGEVPSGGTTGMDKGNLDILRGVDGNLKRVVNLEIAGRFGGVSRRAIEDAAKKGRLKTEGKRTHRRVLVTSLLEYFPPDG